jgi:prophage regulatory protein
MYKLPETGFLRLPDVIGEEEITEEQAKANREYNKQAEADAIKNRRLNKSGKPVYARRPTTARTATPAIIPVKKSCWWQMVRDGRAPKPVKLGRCTMWKVEDIKALIASA